MGTSRNPAELAAKLRAFDNDLESGKISREGVAAAAYEYKRSGEVAYRAASGGDMRLSGVGKRGAKIGVRFDNPVGSVNVTSTVRATGPAHFVDGSTKPHRIPKVRSRGRKRYAVIPGVGVRDHADHPGKRGRSTFHPAMLRAQPRAMRAFATWVAKGLEKRFG